MKKLTLLIVALFWALPAEITAANTAEDWTVDVKTTTTTQQRDAGEPENIITVGTFVDPLFYFLGTGSIGAVISYERAVGPVAIAFSALYEKAGISNRGISAIGGEIDLNCYYGGQLQGLFNGYGIQVYNVTVTHGSTTGSALDFGAVFSGGYRWIWGWFTLDFKVSISYATGGTITTGGSSFTTGGKAAGLGMDLGYAF